jgi:molybdate transport system ATP-binding protein
MMQVRIGKRFPARRDSAAFSLEVAFETKAGITVLFGPSGAGKTLTLDCIAGFATPDDGRILVDDALLFDAAAHVSLSPQARRCGYVFQSHALFPHMTVRENLLFACARGPRLGQRRKVGEMLERFRLTDVAGRRPHEISSGEKQRCSIARALVAAPKVLLLDEPARGLDAPMRAELYALLGELHAEFETPTLVVSHNLEESFELGDQMLVLYNGRLAQSGTPRQILEKPASIEVARLLDQFNLLPVEIVALDPGRNTSRVRFDEFELTGTYLPGHFRGDRVWMGVRPEELLARAREGKPAANQVPSKLERVVETPHGVRLEFERDLSVALARDEYERLRHVRDWVVEFRPEVLRLL